MLSSNELMYFRLRTALNFIWYALGGRREGFIVGQEALVINRLDTTWNNAHGVDIKRITSLTY